MAKCRYCGQRIDWAVTDGGRRIPMDGRGENHFRTCPGWKEMKAKAWSREKEKARRASAAAEREARPGARQLELF